jgi:phosphatidylserine/phosphatidylglycerophosphate/cardiolipin synthase-like enzyme
MSDPLSDAIAVAALHAPAQHLTAAAAAVQDSPRCSPASQTALINAIPASNYRSHATAIAQAWKDLPGLPGASVAAALRSAAATAAAARAEHNVSLVWTGPTTEVTGLRTTRAVLDTLVANATRSLVLVSFASYDVAELAGSLATAINRGVEVTLILETPDDPGGPLIVDAGHPFEPIKTTAKFYRWPEEAREAFFAKSARLHAKCVIADRSAALITSANLTSAGINDNLELGVLIQAGPLPARLSEHLDLLIDQGLLEPA